MHSKSYHDWSVSEAISLLTQYFGTYSYSVSYPELVIPAIVTLKVNASTLFVHVLSQSYDEAIDRDK